MKYFTLILFIFFAFSSHAIIDMKNANYVDTWTDLVIPGTGYDLKVVRTYNSRSLFNGMFGFGWCSDFETKITTTAEGNLKVTECGGGAEVTYSPKNFSKKHIKSMISKIIKKHQEKTRKKFSAKDRKKFIARLYAEPDIRTSYAQKYRVIKHFQEGTTYFANGSLVERIVFKGNSFTRSLVNGTMQRFNRNGRLTHMYDRNRNFLKFTYKKTILREIADNNGRKLLLKYYENGKVKSITGPNNISSAYKYKNLDDLVWVKNGWKNVYTFAYDNLHNLVRINYPDKTFKKISYNKKKDWVKTFRDREGCIESYNYQVDKKDPENHYWSTVQKKCGKRIVNNSRYEFWYRKRSDGQPYLHRVYTKFNSNISDISYHPEHGRPINIRRNEERIAFSYYKSGLVKTKKTPFSFLSFSYDKSSNKVAHVKSKYLNQKGKVIRKVNMSFKYDKKGNLTYAKSSLGQIARLTYDSNGRMATITDQAKKLVKIKYEKRFGKPEYVTRPGVGTIRLSYHKDGSIKKVESKDGPTVAVQVASTFNNLLDLIAPATQELNL